jgi:biofilm PGA synthesis N-glycosyltransferase PgaC
VPPENTLKEIPIATALLHQASTRPGQRDGGTTSESQQAAAAAPDLERELSTLDRTNASMAHRARDCDLPLVTELTRMLDVQLGRVRHGTLALSAARVALMQQASSLLARVLEAHFDGNGIDAAAIASIRSILDTVAMPVAADSSVPRRARTRRGRTISSTGRLVLAIAGALAWAALVALLARPWLANLAPGSILAAFAAVAVMAGLIHAFLLIDLLLSRRPHPSALNYYPPLSILVPMSSNATLIAGTLHSIALQRYPGKLDVIVLAPDGADASLVQTLLDQFPWLRSLRTHAANKAGMLNCALPFTKASLLLALDADCELSPDTLQSMVQCFFNERRQPLPGAVHGSLLVRNGSANWLTKVLRCNSLHGLSTLQRAQSQTREAATGGVGGAPWLVARAKVTELGGWPAGADLELALARAILRGGDRIEYSAQAAVLTNAPLTLGQLLRQLRHALRAMLQGARADLQHGLAARAWPGLLYWNALVPLLELTFTLLVIPAFILGWAGHAQLAALALLPLGLGLRCMLYALTWHRRAPGGTLPGLLMCGLIDILLVKPACLLASVAELMRVKPTSTIG